MPAARTEVVAVCTLGLNLFRALIVYLKPVYRGGGAGREAIRGRRARLEDAAKPLLDRRIESSKPFCNASSPRRRRTRSSMKRGPPAPPRRATATAPTEDADDRSSLLSENGSARRKSRAEASLVEGADKLLRLQLDLDGEERVVFAGIRSAYEPGALVGKLVVLVANSKPRKMRFGVSQGMVLAASGKDGGVFPLHPDDGARPGMKVS